VNATEAKHAMMRDAVMTWEEISSELIFGDYDPNGPEIQKISPERLEEFCKRFPHFENDLRSFVDDWNREPMLTPAMLAEIEHAEVSQEELDKSWRRTKMMLDFYRKLRVAEAERDTYKATAESLREDRTNLVAAFHDVMRFFGDDSWTDTRGRNFNPILNQARKVLAKYGGQP
jgi:sulfur relay (sulfurtransferase) DsrC/TusE family protein